MGYRRDDCNIRRVASIAKKSVGGRTAGGVRLGSGIIVRYGTGQTIAIEGDTSVTETGTWRRLGAKLLRLIA